jgi:hypothetical protein
MAPQCGSAFLFLLLALPAMAQSTRSAGRELPILPDGRYPTQCVSAIEAAPLSSQDDWSFISWVHNDVHKINGAVYAMEDYGYIGGQFTSIDGSTCKNIAEQTGSYPTTYGPVGGGIDGPVYAIAPAWRRRGTTQDQVIIVGGRFDHAGVIPCHNLALWDGSQWWPLGKGADSTVLTIYAADSMVYIGGNFTHVGPIAANHIVQYNVNSGMLSPFVSNGVNGVNGGVAAIGQLDPHGYEPRNVIVGGSFDRVGNTSAACVATWTDSTWNTLGTGLSGYGGAFVTAITPLALWMGTEHGCVVGGRFDTAGSVSARNVARWNSDSLRWESIGTGKNNGVDGDVYAISSSPLGDFIGGSFTHAGTTLANNIVLNLHSRFGSSISDTGQWWPMQDGLNGACYVIASSFIMLTRPNDGKTDPVILDSIPVIRQLEGDLLAGGAFTTSNDTLSPGIAHWVYQTPSAVKDPRVSAIPPHVTIYPNPLHTGGAVSIAVTQSAPAISRIELVDALGRIVTSRPLFLREGKSQILFSIDHLRSGVYVCKVMSGTSVMQCTPFIVE